MASHSFKEMNNLQLREELLKHGYDVPVSISKDFMIRKLQKLAKEGKLQNSPSRLSRATDSSSNEFARSSRSNRRSTPNVSSSTSTSTIRQKSVNTKTSITPRRTTLGPSVVSRSGAARNTSSSSSVATQSKSLHVPMKRKSNSGQKRIRLTDETNSESDSETAAMETESFLNRSRASASPKLHVQQPIMEFKVNQSASDACFMDRFGLVASGKQVEYKFYGNDVIEPSKFITNIPDAEQVDHVAVFCNPQRPFETGKAAKVFLGWPNQGKTSMDWHELGHISNSRPSGIFNVAPIKAQLNCSRASPSVTAEIGISIEPLELILSNINFHSRTQLS